MYYGAGRNYKVKVANNYEKLRKILKYLLELIVKHIIDILMKKVMHI